MLLNVLANKQLDWLTHMEKGMGITPDISPFLQFQWYEPVVIYENDCSFPATKERLGYWCGTTENCGDAMTYWILTKDTNQLVARSNVRSALTPADSSSNVPVNFRAYFSDDFEGSDSKKPVSVFKEDGDDSVKCEEEDRGLLQSSNKILAKINRKTC